MRLVTKNFRRNRQPEFNVKELFGVIQVHAFGDHQKTEGQCTGCGKKSNPLSYFSNF